MDDSWEILKTDEPFSYYHWKNIDCWGCYYKYVIETGMFDKNQSIHNNPCNLHITRLDLLRLS